MQRTKNIGGKWRRRLTAGVSALTLLMSTSPPVMTAYAAAPDALFLPSPGMPVTATAPYNPPLLHGLEYFPDRPLRFSFFLDTGESELAGDTLQRTSQQQIQYFLTALTIPDDELWVNLSPHEQDRMMPAAFGRTAMGRDLLAQDYVLKQFTASLLSPEHPVGRRFWREVRARAAAELGTGDVPVDTFNKVWIVPQAASVYRRGNRVFVIGSRLQVMLEQDYVLTQQARAPGRRSVTRSSGEPDKAAAIARAPSAG